MFFQSPMEEKLRTNEKKLKELGIQLEKLSEDVDRFYKENDLDADAIEKFFDTPANFSEEEHELLQMLLDHHKKKMDTINKQIVDPRDVRKKYSERVVDPRWLFVR